MVLSYNWKKSLQFSIKMKGFLVAYYSYMRFATTKSSVEALVPFFDTATSNINLSSSAGRYGSREFIQDIEMLVLWSQIENEVASCRGVKLTSHPLRVHLLQEISKHTVRIFIRHATLNTSEIRFCSSKAKQSTESPEVHPYISTSLPSKESGQGRFEKAFPNVARRSYLLRAKTTKKKSCRWQWSKVF